MAPRKTKPAKGGIKEAEEVTSPEIFVDEKAKERHQRVVKKGILWERGFRLDTEKEDSDLRKKVEERKWQKFCSHTEEVVLNWILEFYSNAPSFIDEKVVVRGTQVDCSGVAVNRVLGLEAVRLDSHTLLSFEKNKEKILSRLCPEEIITWTTGKKKAFRADALSPEAKVWLHFVSSCISPTSHTSDVSIERGMIIYSIIEGLSINPGFIIADKLKRSMIKDAGAIIFPCLVSKLCAAAGVPRMDNDVVRPVGHPISSAMFIKSVDTPISDVMIFPNRFRRKELLPSTSGTKEEEKLDQDESWKKGLHKRPWLEEKKMAAAKPIKLTERFYDERKEAHKPVDEKRPITVDPIMVELLEQYRLLAQFNAEVCINIIRNQEELARYLNITYFPGPEAPPIRRETTRRAEDVEDSDSDEESEASG